MVSETLFAETRTTSAWFGHLSRMNEDRKPRQFFEARPDGGPGLHTSNAYKRWGGKYPKAWRNLKEWLKTEKVKVFLREPPDTN